MHWDSSSTTSFQASLHSSRRPGSMIEGTAEINVRSYTGNACGLIDGSTDEDGFPQRKEIILR